MQLNASDQKHLSSPLTIQYLKIDQSVEEYSNENKWESLNDNQEIISLFDILFGILSKGRGPSPFKTILSLFMTSQENEPKHKISKVLKEIFSIKENIVIS